MAEYPLPESRVPGIGPRPDWSAECVARRKRALDLLDQADRLEGLPGIQIAIAAAQVQATLAAAAATMATRKP